MKKLAIGLLLTLCVTLGVFSVSGATKKPTIVIDNAYPPYMYASSGQPSGLYYELMKKVFDRAVPS